MANTTLSKDEILDAIGAMSVIDLSELIEAFKTKFNVTIAAVAAGGGGGAAAPAAAAEEQTEFAVILKEAGGKKIQVKLPQARPSSRPRARPSKSRKALDRSSL